MVGFDGLRTKVGKGACILTGVEGEQLLHPSKLR